VWKHHDLERKNPTLTASQISDKIAGFFNHGSDINQGYLRNTFDRLDDPLARKGGALPTISEDDEAGPSRLAPEPKKKPAARVKAAPKPPRRRSPRRKRRLPNLPLRLLPSSPG
jgi:hypothetical protein